MNPGWGKLAANSYSEIPFVRNAQTLRNLGTALTAASLDVTGTIPLLAEKLVRVFRGEVSVEYAPGELPRQLQVVLNGKPVLWQASNKGGRPLDWPLHAMLLSALRALRKELEGTDAQKASAELFAAAEGLYPHVESWLDSLFADGKHDAAPMLTLDTRGLVAARRSIHAAELNIDFGQRVAADTPRNRAAEQTALGQTLDAEAAEAPSRSKKRKPGDNGKPADNGKAGGSSKSRRSSVRRPRLPNPIRFAPFGRMPACSCFSALRPGVPPVLATAALA
jgi:hypothetical protein